MKESLKAGIEHEFSFKVSEKKTVPALYPEAEEFQAMPNVFATGYMVGFIEWACIQAINPYLDWPQEQTVGIGINVNHIAATPPGLTVTAKVILKKIDGRKLFFEVEAHDGIDQICSGTHERFIIYQKKFNKKVSEKAESVK